MKAAVVARQGWGGREALPVEGSRGAVAESAEVAEVVVGRLVAVRVEETVEAVMAVVVMAEATAVSMVAAEHPVPEAVATAEEERGPVGKAAPGACQGVTAVRVAHCYRAYPLLRCTLASLSFA